MKSFQSFFVFALIIFVSFMSSTSTITAQSTILPTSYKGKIKIPKGTILKKPIKIVYPNIRLQADLVITSFRNTGRAVQTSAGHYQLPIQVVIKNKGNVNAENFKLSVDYVCTSNDCPSYLRGRSFVTSLNVAGQRSGYYPYIRSLSAGQSRTLSGTLGFRHRGIYELQVMVDSGSGDEFMPSYIRVKESNENNNLSRKIRVNVRP